MAEIFLFFFKSLTYMYTTHFFSENRGEILCTSEPVNSGCNISNPTMRTGLDFKSAQFDQIGSKFEDLKSSPVRIGGFEMTSHANKSLLN